MPTFDFLVVYDSRTYLCFCPFSVLDITKVILLTSKHGDGNFNFPEVDHWRNMLAIVIKVESGGTIVIKGKSAGGNWLGEMHVAFGASPSRNVAHINLESVNIVEAGILSDQETFTVGAHVWQNAAS